MLNFFTSDEFVKSRVQKEMNDFKRELDKKNSGKKNWKAELIESLLRK